MSGCPYALIFLQKEIRVEISIARASKEENKFIFDFLVEKKEKIEADFGNALDWLRLDDKKSSRIQFIRKVDGFNKDNWPEWVEWHLTQMINLQKAFKVPLQQASDALKQRV